MRLSAVHSTSVARTVSLDIKEHSGRSAMGVTSADRRNGTIGDGRVMPDRARPQSSPLQKNPAPYKKKTACIRRIAPTSENRNRSRATHPTGATHPTATATATATATESWRSQGRNQPAKQNYVLALAKSSSTEVAADIDADARCVRAMRNCASSRVSNQRSSASVMKMRWSSTSRAARSSPSV